MVIGGVSAGSRNGNKYAGADGMPGIPNAAKEALAGLEYPLTQAVSGSSEVPREQAGEKAFYRNLVDKPERMQRNVRTEQDTLAADESVTPVHSITFREMLANKINEIVEKIEDGVTEPSFAIGASSFTLEEWEIFLKLFDKIEEEMKKAAGQEVPPEETLIANEEEIKADSDMNLMMLVSESTSCRYPASEETEDDTQYITYYTRDAIYCKKEGEFGYEWEIPLTEDSQYDQVMKFLNYFDTEENLRFACHENFWQDFLSGALDMDGFMNFMETRVSGGIPNYVNVDGDTMWIDREAAQYAKYMNEPDLFHIIAYTDEEFFAWQEKQMAEMRGKLKVLFAKS